jgi:hypothetical protein
MARVMKTLRLLRQAIYFVVSTDSKGNYAPPLAWLKMIFWWIVCIPMFLLCLIVTVFMPNRDEEYYD